MFDFNLIPLYPREIEKAEKTDKPFITSKIFNICANHLWNRLAKFRDENTPSNRSFCLVLKSKNTIYAKSTNFFINPTYTNCSENYAVCFEEMLGDKSFNKYRSDYLSADITQRRKATAYSYSEVKKTLRLKSITEEQYLSYVLLNDYDFIFYSKHFGIDRKVAKKRMKDKIEQWKENYYNSIVAEYMISSRKKSNYMSDKLKEADNILKNIGEVQAEMRSRLKCLLAVVLCFDEFIKAEHPELSDQSEKLIEKTISLNKRLYFRQTLNQLALLDLGSTTTTFCSFIKNLERTFDETEDNGRYQKLFFIKTSYKKSIP